MISTEQLEKLENRILKALDLISDLRVENNQLELELDKLIATNEKLQFTNAEQQKRIDDLDQKLEQATGELRDIKKREDNLEHRIDNIISRLDNIQRKDDPDLHTSYRSESSESSLSENKKTNEPLPKFSSKEDNTAFESDSNISDKIFLNPEDEDDNQVSFLEELDFIEEQQVNSTPEVENLENISPSLTPELEKNDDIDLIKRLDSDDMSGDIAEEEIFNIGPEESSTPNGDDLLDSSVFDDSLSLPSAKDENLFEDDHDFMLLEDEDEKKNSDDNLN